MRKTLIAIALTAVSLPAAALEVEATAGQLEGAIDDYSITELTVTGTLDARDFRFIADRLTQLTTLNLADVQIEAYDDLAGSMLSLVTQYPAATLPAGALLDTQLQNVVLPSSLTAIGEGAMAGCTSLTTIQLPATLATIEPYAFSHTALTAIDLPATVQSVGTGAFARCPDLVSATVNCVTLGNDAFKACTALAEVRLGDQVTTLGDGAFAGCASLETVTLGDNPALEDIGREAFAGTAIKSVDLAAMTALRSVGAWAFAGSAIEQVEIPEQVESLGEGAFFYTSQLTQATLPAVAQVADYTFAGAAATPLGEILPEGVERIGNYAFYDNTATASLVLPSTVTSIGTRAMAGMVALQQIDVLGGVAELGDSVWAGIDQSLVRLETGRDNDVSDRFAAADQWRDFHIMRNYLLGDVNNDTRVNVRDITTTVDYVLEREPAVFVFPAADIVGDSTINVRDITALAELILDEDFHNVRAIKRRAGAPAMPTTTDRLVMPDFDFVTLSATAMLALDNARPYNALQCDIALPEGVVLAECRPMGRLSGFVTSVASFNGGYRLVAYSLGNAAIAPGNDAVLELTLQATEAIPEAGQAVEVDGIVLADLDSDYAADPVSALVTTPAITALDDVAAGMNAWGENGRVAVESTMPATVRIVATNGTTREVNVGAGVTRIDVQPGVYVVVMPTRSRKVVVK